MANGGAVKPDTAPTDTPNPIRPNATSAHNPAGRGHRAPRRHRARRSARAPGGPANPCGATRPAAAPGACRSAPTCGAGGDGVAAPAKTAGSAPVRATRCPGPCPTQSRAAQRQIPPGSCHARPCGSRRCPESATTWPTRTRIPAPAGSPTRPSRSRRPAAPDACPPPAAKPSHRLVPACSHQVGLAATTSPGMPCSVRDSGSPVVPSFRERTPRVLGRTANASTSSARDGGPNQVGDGAAAEHSGSE
jgi:hypothetical protein